jgi:N-acetylglutamate synthase-like GNAT family acetyltransferase
MEILKAKPTDSEMLTKLMRESKAHWGYSDEQLHIWADELTVNSSYIDENHVYKLTEQNDIIGYYSFFLVSEQTAKLDSLFISPKVIGSGFGKLLLDDFLRRISPLKLTSITLDSDPNAEGFYRRNGFDVVERKSTSIAGRTMPVMTKTI